MASLTACLVFFVFYFLYAWRLEHLIVRGDGPHGYYPLIKKFLTIDGQLHNFIYRPNTGGGSAILGIFGTLPIYHLANFFKLTTLQTLNLAALSAIFLWGVVSFKVTQTVLALRNIPIKNYLICTPLLIVCSTFAPILAWRIQDSHINLIYGALSFLCMISVYLSIRSCTLTATYGALAFFTICSGLSTFGYQMMVYGLVFGAPVMLGIALANQEGDDWFAFVKQETTALFLSALIFIIGIITCWPWFSVALKYNTSPDALRTDSNLIFSYASSTLSDYFYSLFLHWEPALVKPQPGLDHELNYPAGPYFALLLLMFFYRYWRSLSLGLAASLLLCLGFSLNIPPVVSILTHLVGFLASFRVPSRAMIIFVMSLSPLVLAFLIAKHQSHKISPFKFYSLAYGALVVLFFTPSIFNELALWLMVLMLGVTWALRSLQAYLIALILPLLAISSLRGFQERLPATGELHQQVAAIEGLANQLPNKFPELLNPLNRVRVEIAGTPFGANLAQVLGISAIDAYYTLPRRFSELFHGLEGASYDSTTVIFTANKQLRSYPIIEKYYNIRYVARGQQGGIVVEPLGYPDLSVWRPLEIHLLETREQAISAIKELAQTNLSALHSIAFVEEAEPVAKKIYSEHWQTGKCNSFQPKLLAARYGGQILEIATTGSVGCVAIVAANYIEGLEAIGNQGELLPVFPVNVALLGIWVPINTEQVTIRPRLSGSLPNGFLFYVGLAMFLLWLMIIILLGKYSAPREL